MKTLSTLAVLILAGCSTTEELGECLDWHTEVVERRERLPYPMQGVVVREEKYTYCRSRKNETETA